jgi:hypothetical protein
MSGLVCAWRHIQDDTSQGEAIILNPSVNVAPELVADTTLHNHNSGELWDVNRFTSGRHAH